jgi:hypothetical protein
VFRLALRGWRRTDYSLPKLVFSKYYNAVICCGKLILWPTACTIQSLQLRQSNLRGLLATMDAAV